jgi:folate-binding protein YgfZ
VATARARLIEGGVVELAPGAAEGIRIAALEPRFGAEITPDYFPMEVGLDSAIDYRKGCYLGQEPIVRIRDRGHLNWRLVGLDVVSPGEAVPGAPLESDTKPKAGRITSFGRLPDGSGVALAMLHVSVAVGSTIRIHPAEPPGAPSLEARVRAEITSPSR